MVIRVQKGIIMKKKYFTPDMEIVEIKTQMILAASMPGLTNTEMEIGDDVMAPPGLEVGPNIPGMPSFIFQ